MFWVLLRYRLRMMANAVRFSTARERWFGALLTILTLLLTVGVYVGFYMVFLVRGSGASGLALAHELALSLFVFMLAGAVPFLAATLLHPGDVELLGSAPVPPRSAVMLRLLEGAAAGAVQFVPIGAPAVVACLVGLRAPLVVLPVAILPSVFLILIPSLLSSVVLLTAVRWLGYGRVRSAIALVYVVLGAAVCYLLVSQVTSLRLHEGLKALATGTANPSGRIAYWPPWGWFGAALYAMAQGNTATFWKCMAAMTVTTAVLGAVALWLGSVAWLTGILAGGGGPSRAARHTPRAADNRLLRLLPKPLLAVLRKEFRYMVRDPLLLAQASMPAILFLVPFIMAANPTFASRAPADELFVVAVLMVVAVEYMQASVLSASSVGMEGRAFWAFLTSPNDALLLLWGKWLASWLVTSGVACSMVCFAGLVFRVDSLLVAVLCAALTAAAGGLCGLGAGIAAALPRFTFENPAHRVSPAAMVVGFGLGMAYSAAVWGTLAGMWLAAAEWPTYAAYVYASGAAVVLGATLVACVLPIGLGVQRLRALEWPH